MKVKIGNIIIDANEEPVMLIFEDVKERSTVADHLTNMGEAKRYCMFPKEMDKDIVREFMKI